MRQNNLQKSHWVRFVLTIYCWAWVYVYMYVYMCILCSVYVIFIWVQVLCKCYVLSSAQLLCAPGLSGWVVPRRWSYSTLPHPVAHTVLPLHLQWCSLGLRCEMDISFGASHSVSPLFQHFGQLWVPALAIIHCRQKLPWPKLRESLAINTNI